MKESKQTYNELVIIVCIGIEDIEEEVHNAIDKERQKRMLLLCIFRQIINTELPKLFTYLC